MNEKLSRSAGCLLAGALFLAGCNPTDPGPDPDPPEPVLQEGDAETSAGVQDSASR